MWYILACRFNREYLIEEYARIPVEVEYASEFRYRNPIVTNKDVVIAISQSGEPADTMAAIKLAKERGAFIYGICNVVDSSILMQVLIRTQVQKLELLLPKHLQRN